MQTRKLSDFEINIMPQFLFHFHQQYSHSDSRTAPHSKCHHDPNSGSKKGLKRSLKWDSLSNNDSESKVWKAVFFPNMGLQKKYLNLYVIIIMHPVVLHQYANVLILVAVYKQIQSVNQNECVETWKHVGSIESHKRCFQWELIGN